MVKYLSIGPGSMGYFMYLGLLSKMKNEGSLDELAEISGASAGGLLAFIYCMFKGNTSKSLDYSLNAPTKAMMKPNIKNLLLNYGLISTARIRKLLEKLCILEMDKDPTFDELYKWYPVKLHLSAFCLELNKTIYFSADTTPSMKVIDAVCATIAMPLLFSPLKLSDGWHYIDGGTAEMVPGGPFLGKGEGVLCIKLDWGKVFPIKDIKTYLSSVLYSTMKLRYQYEFPTLAINIDDIDLFDYGTSNESKLRLFVMGQSHKFSK